jgi:hypothetical protein
MNNKPPTLPDSELIKLYQETLREEYRINSALTEENEGLRIELLDLKIQITNGVPDTVYKLIEENMKLRNTDERH